MKNKKAIINGNLFTITNGVIENGTVLIKNGKIAAFGTNVEIPKDAEIIDVKGMIVTPGIIDAHAHVEIWEEGLGMEGMDCNEMTNPVTAHVRAVDAINPEGIGMRDALTGGITTIWDAPGSANVIGGHGVTLKTSGNIIDEMIMLEPSGLKAATGENPKGCYGQEKESMPMTRMGVAAVMREALIKAQEYLKKIEKAGDDEDKMPDRDLGLETIGKVLNREIPLRVHCHRHDDIVTVVRISKEFNIKVSIEHATEAHKIADFLAENQIPIVVGPSITTRSKVELTDRSLKTAGICASKGVPVSLMTDHPIIPVHHLHLCAAFCVKHGMTEEQALRAITINPAQLCGVGDRVGSIDIGKDADLAVWTHHPFDIMSKVKYTFIDGEIVYSQDSGCCKGGIN
ncbi:amidohydrolase [Clostridium sp. 'deep sea']|uniref:amidohydrolase n=1 Tax=Clostridium sp. 'deep sea' TaxID=2779445 RepID=UPI001FABCB0F|nr:amidohydrolase [Clostridium sp. 'deep sea']